jgi:hypothetical protein
MKTPIEQWIEEESEGRYPVKRYQTPIISPYVGIQKTFQHGINAALTYLGLQDLPNPKEWIEEMKKKHE